MAQLRRLREQFSDELVVIGVHSAKFPSEQLTGNIRQAVMRHGIDHPVVNDAGFKIWNSYAVRAWPTLVLIDPTGRIAGEISGEIMAEDLAKNIIEVIQQHPDAIDRTRLELRPETQLEPERPLAYPSKLLVHGDRLFISDTGHNRVIEVRLDADGVQGEVLRVFGSGEAALRDGPAEAAAFNHPHGLGLEGSLESGTLYVADTENHAIRAIDLGSGEVRTIAGTGQKAHGRLALGKPTETPLRSPWAVVPIEQFVLIAMAGSHQIWVLIRSEASGEFEQLGPFAGNGVEDLVDGPVAESSFNQPSDLALGLGHLFVADPEASAIRAISLAEQPKTVTLIGQGLFDFGDQDGRTDAALLQHPTGVALGDMVVFIADTYNHKVKRLDPVAGEITTLIGSGKPGWKDGTFTEAQFYEPEGLQVQGERIYIADTNNHLIRVADLTARRVHTLTLRSMERLAMPNISSENAEALAPVQVGPGQVRMELDLHLPQGYKRNADAPTQVTLGEGESAVTHTFSAAEPLVWTVDVDGGNPLPVDLTVYYCQEQEAQLCLIHNRMLSIPLEIVPEGPKEVRVPYTVTL